MESEHFRGLVCKKKVLKMFHLQLTPKIINITFCSKI